MGAALCGNQISGAPPIDETCFRSYFCAMVCFDGAEAHEELTHWLISTQAPRGPSTS